MIGDPKHQILLLPSENYWDWVQAVRDYAVFFSVNITPDPLNAVGFNRPEQVISVVDKPDAYPEQGNILDWLAEHAADIKLDVIKVTTPSFLHQLLVDRVAQNRRFGDNPLVSLTTAEQLTVKLLWPTDYPVITQPFGANPDLYRKWGFPGHEGVDLRAPTNSRVYACADGEVARVHDGLGGHPYGIHIRIQHSDEYLTIYGHLNQALVHTGQVVKAGDVIGLSDSTGNSTNPHLHLTLKKEGASAAGETIYPHDIIDRPPTRHLSPSL